MGKDRGRKIMINLEPNPYERRVKKSILIDHAMNFHVGDRKCVIQAGGHVGVWPNRLVEYFDEVHTFEPHPDNYTELVKNTLGKPQIITNNCALGEEEGEEPFRFSKKSSGMHHIDRSGDILVRTVAIDDYCELHNIHPTAIFLDVEGFEMFVLRGAVDTISKLRPLISCEENHAGSRWDVEEGDLEKWLSIFDYKVGRRHKKDIIFCQI